MRIGTAVLGQRPRQARPGRHEYKGHGDQDRHDGGECAGKGEQQQGAGQPSRAGGDAQPNRPGSLAGQLAPVSVRSAQRARNQAHGVRDVGVEWVVAEGQQGGEGYQRAGANDRVDRSGCNSRAEDRPGFEGVMAAGLWRWFSSVDRIRGAVAGSMTCVATGPSMG